MVSRVDNFKRGLILAVEDGADDLELIIQVLELMGFPLITATDGRTSIAMAQQHQPDLILLDMVLPDMSGLEVAQRLKQDSRTAEIPIIAVTAMVSKEQKERCLSAGCVDFIAKPYDIEFLETVIKRYLS
ncbi:MAG: Polar-differentiation response regulator DivK [Chroococcidiopsis sp. SAG 2025]|uniref:response regulator n=1 Tax=Chroococcidiopsis sp. SAG 2025 TaxID=171389 RepID=UPI0029373C06|nr:response regulator [Chroococcidiopsis sp. SAG 2025]MDV2993190.1 Polar-differentiation response regulator DivK [Chroococcidiopsis sp. SAG 2025]